MDRIQDLLKQIRRHPYRPDLHNSLGRLYQQQGDRPEAAKHFLAAARLFSDSGSPARNLNKAVATLKKLLRDFPNNHDSYYLLADIHTEMDNRDAAMDVFRLLSDVYRQEGKLLMAVSVYDKITGSEPDNLKAWLRFAELNEQAGMPFHAAQAFVRAANLCLGAGDPRESYSLSIKALRLDSDNSNARVFIQELLESNHAGAVDTDELMDFALGLQKQGLSEQSIAILSLLAKTSLSGQAADMIEKIRGRTGIIPVHKDPHPQKRHQPGKYAGMRVLVVDDEREILLLLEQILKGEGMNVLTARDGEKAYEIFQREQPPVVVTDAMLPKLHGFELCRRIKEDSDNAVKVMILTAVYKKYKYKSRVQEEFHVDEYLDKPFQIAEFLDVFYQMVDDLSEPLAELKPSKDKDLTSAEGFTILVVGEGERDLISHVSHFCDRNGCNFQIQPGARGMIEYLEKDVPDIILLSDRMTGMDPFVAAWLIKDIMGIRSATLVLMAGDRKLLEGEPGDFHHRVAVPIGQGTMDTIIRLHNSARERSVISATEKGMAAASRRMEAVLRSKVDHVLKSQHHIESYYTNRIKELEEEIENLKGPRQGKQTGGT
jgi:CheY-like chemotaxis protein/Tfp pilus assembly protein PilF